MNKPTVKQISGIAILTAMYCVLSATMKIPFIGAISLDLGYIALTLGCAMYGMWGAFIGAVGCGIESILFSPYGFSIGWFVANFIIGLGCGYVFKHTKATWARIAAIIIFVAIGMLGAKTAIGVDIDPKAEDIARENAAINGLGSDRFSAVTGDVIGDRAMMEKLSGGYDLVLANIVADVIIPLSPVVPHFMKQSSLFICSGILEQRLEEVKAAIVAAGLRIISVNMIEDWCQITACLA